MWNEIFSFSFSWHFTYIFILIMWISHLHSFSHVSNKEMSHVNWSGFFCYLWINISSCKLHTVICNWLFTTCGNIRSCPLQFISHHLSNSVQLWMWCFLCDVVSQVGDQRINTTTCGCPWWVHCCAVSSCLSSTGGPLSSHTALKSSSTSMSQSRSQVSCVDVFGSTFMMPERLN